MSDGRSGAAGARWVSDVVQLTVDATVDAASPGAIEAVVQAVTAWQAVPAALPTLVVARGAGAPLGYDANAELNQNTIRFMAEGAEQAKGALAITIITFDTTAGEILDADVLINGEHAFRRIDAEQLDEEVYDLQNVLTHELGHLLGLGENYEDEGATMYAYSQPRETTKRDLSGEDLSSIEALYDSPPEGAVGHGGATKTGRAARGSGWMLAALGLGGCAVAARRLAVRNAALGSMAALALGFGGARAIGTSVEGVAGALHPETSRVVSQHSEFEGGVIVTTLRLSTGATEREISVLGGTVGSITQVVGNLLPPNAGDSIDVRAVDRLVPRRVLISRD